MDTLDGLVRFGRFTYDAASGELTVQRRSVRLQPQPAQVLSLLILRAGEVVTREELREAIWPDTTVEFDQGLNYCIRQIRSALGEQADNPVFIETLPRRGYRFIAPVEYADDSAPTSIAGPAEARASTSARTALAAAALTALAGALLWILVAGSISEPAGGDAQPGSDRALVAVLPLTVLGDSAAGSFVSVSHAFADEVITALSQADPERLGVIAPASAFRVGPGRVDPRVAAERLSVGYLLDGSVRTDGEVVSVVVQLKDAPGGLVHWAHSFERPIEDVSQIPFEDGRDVAGAVAAVVAPDVTLSRASSRPALPRAQRDQYLRARYLMSLYRYRPMQEATVLLDSLIDLAPHFSAAHSARALAAGLLGEEALSRLHVELALGADSTNHEAHWVLAVSELDLLRWAPARSHFETALRLAPGVADYRRSFALYHSYLGNHREALQELDRALELDPVTPAVRGDLGQLHLAAGDPAEAIEACSLMERLAGGPSERTGRCLLRARLALADTASAADVVRSLLDLRDDNRALPREPGLILDAFWSRELDRVSTLPDDDPQRWMRAAEAYAGLGEADQALESLEAGARLDLRPFLDEIGNPLFDRLRDSSRWRALVDRARPSG